MSALWTRRNWMTLAAISGFISVAVASTSMVSSSTGKTNTEAKEVWRRAAESKGEIRTSRCTPVSAFRYP